MELDNTQVPRATNIQELIEIMDKFSNNQSWEEGLKFKPGATDIIISPNAKCGTTMLQQIAHALRTRGNMDFEEITVVTPWIELAADVGWNLNEQQVAEPRVFKSHLNWYNIPKGAKYICSFRDCKSMVVSKYRFFEGMFFEPATITVDELFAFDYPREEMATHGYWYHLASWWEQHDNENVLLFCYEDMIEDMPGTIKKVADFMGIELDVELLEITLHNSSREFMLAHVEQFNSRYYVEAGRKRINIPPPISFEKVTPGIIDNDRYLLSEDTKRTIDELWKEHITEKYGLKSYEELREKVKGLNSSK